MLNDYTALAPTPSKDSSADHTEITDHTASAQKIMKTIMAPA